MHSRSTQLWIAALLIACAAPSAQASGGWLTDFEKAKAQAKKEGKVILADFTGSDWCYWCKRLDKEVFTTSEFKSWAKKRAVLLEVDFPARKKQKPALKAQNEELQKTYGIEGYPTVIFLDSAGKELGRHGYQKGGPEAWIAKAEEVLSKKPQEEKQPGAAPAAGAWGEDYQAALAEAKKSGKLILADFTGSDWCGWCRKLKQEVFDEDAFKAWAKENVVLLELDFPRDKEQDDALKQQNKALLEKHGVKGFPTILFLDADGQAVGRSGYLPGGPDAWIENAQKIVDANTK